ncbi:putative MYND-type zinc finger protein samB [Seiridium cardinale]|uniref:MYND-type zinc finger protein samB n=1 Tax=Seiridium cardinale TaxID=138064 RepID=A0ABR2XHP1_9PEZI
MTNRMNLGLPFAKCYHHPCFEFDNLLKCGACHIALYCSAEHQKAHRPVHKTSCKIIKDAGDGLRQAEADLRARPGDARMPANPFENAVGTFWFWTPTRPYMQQRYDLMTARLNIRTGEAVQAALDDCLDMLRLCRGDNQTVRRQVPALQLRLGKDQDAYDHIKWWATTGAKPDYDWRDTSEPFLDLHDEDAFERSDDWMAKLWDLSFKATMTLLKLRLMLDVKGLQMHTRKNPGLTYEKKMEWVIEEAMSDIMYNQEVVDRDNYDDLASDLADQVNKLYEWTKEENPHYWQAILQPDEYTHATPTIYSRGSKEEVILSFRHTWYAWSECPPAIEFVREKATNDRG